MEENFEMRKAVLEWSNCQNKITWNTAGTVLELVFWDVVNLPTTKLDGNSSRRASWIYWKNSIAVIILNREIVFTSCH